MGLAASQARLISLQARMSDTEYEGQQINQQRQVLANKMNEVYNQAMDMDVPTPPSKIDFAYNNAYVGTGKNSKYKFTLNDDGTYRCFTQEEGTYYKETNNFKLPALNSTTTDTTELVRTIGDVDEVATGTEEYYDVNGNKIEPSIAYTYTTSKGGETSTVVLYHEMTSDDIENGGFKLTEQKNVFKAGTAIYKKIPAGTSTTGNYFGSYNEVKGRADADLQKQLEGALATLQSSETDISNLKEGELGVVVEKLGNNYRISFYSLKDAKIQGDNIDTVYQATSGTYEKTVEDGLMIDEVNGKVELSDKTSIKLSATGDLYNEMDYNAAYVQYERDKVEYDKEQNEFNKQTSIYQRQDKQLELKLTRLDNERNALNTEIDAVKKVIQDAVDKGFKTFSG